MGGNTEGERAHSLVGVRFIAAQFVPMLVLGLAYLSSQHQISRVYVGGASLDRLLLTSAVIAPLLSQSVSGPLFRSLEVRPSRRFRQTAELALRNLPRSLVMAAPVLVGVCSVTALVLHMDPRAAAALMAVAWLHLVFAASLVPAYAHRRGLLLIVGWSSYAVALATATSTWWAPPVAGAASQLMVLLSVARTPAHQVPLVSFGSMLTGLGRGLSLALPLWCLPVGVYLGSDGQLSPFAIFVSLTPAVLAYQVYFVLIATPVWTRIDRARELLAHQPYPQARAELLAIARQVRVGINRTVGLVGVLLLATSGVVAANAFPDGLVLLELSATACLSVLTITEATRLIMVRNSAVPFVVTILTCVPAMVAAMLAAPSWVILAAHASSCLLSLVALTLANRVVWRTPEYSLFWAKALHA